MGKSLRILIPTAILFGFIVLPFIGVNYSPKQERPQQRKVSHLEFIKPLNQFLEEQRRILKYDEKGYLIPDIAKGWSATLFVQLKINDKAILPDGATASYTTIYKYIQNIITSGKNDPRLKTLNGIDDLGAQVVRFNFNKLVSKSDQLPYDIFGRNVFDTTYKPRVEQTITLDIRTDNPSFQIYKTPIKTNSISYSAIAKLAMLGKGIEAPADNINIPNITGNEWIARFPYGDINLQSNESYNIQVIPSRIKTQCILGFNLRNPRFRSINRRKILYNAINEEPSAKLQLPIEIIYPADKKMFMKALKVASQWKSLGCNVTTTELDYNNFANRIERNNFDVFIYNIDVSDLYLDGFYSYINKFGYVNKAVDKLITDLDGTFEPPARNSLKSVIINKIKEDAPYIFLGEEPKYLYLVGSKENLDTAIKNMR